MEGTHPGSLEAAIQESTLIRLASLGTFPLVGGRLRATARVAPTAEKGPGTLVRRRQAQKRNRTSHNFLPPQAPSGAGRNRAQALLILRAGRILPAPRDNPRKRGPGKGEYEREALI